MYLIIGLMTLITMFSWTLLISVLNLRYNPIPNLWLKDGTYFCENCNHVVGYRRDGKEFVNGNFVEKCDELVLPSNVVLFKKK